MSDSSSLHYSTRPGKTKNLRSYPLEYCSQERFWGDELKLALVVDGIYALRSQKRPGN